MKRNLLIWFTILSSLIGCVDDKSNTRIEELNEVTIGALQEKYSAETGKLSTNSSSNHNTHR